MKKNMRIAAGLLALTLVGGAVPFGNTAFSLTANAAPPEKGDTGVLIDPANATAGDYANESIVSIAGGNSEVLNYFTGAASGATSEDRSVTITVGTHGTIAVECLDDLTPGQIVLKLTATPDSGYKPVLASLTDANGNALEFNAGGSSSTGTTDAQTLTFNEDVKMTINFVNATENTGANPVTYLNSADKPVTVTDGGYVKFDGNGIKVYNNYEYDQENKKQEQVIIGDTTFGTMTYVTESENGLTNSYDNTCYYINGEVNLVLTDGTTTKINATWGGLALAGGKLNIYGQANGTGKLIINGNTDLEELNIYGGQVEFSGAGKANHEEDYDGTVSVTNSMNLGWTSPQNYIKFGGDATCKNITTVKKKAFQNEDAADTLLYLNAVSDSTLGEHTIYPSPVVKSMSLTLSDNIGVNFKMDNSALASESQAGSGLLFDITNDNGTVLYAHTVNDKPSYQRLINANQMADSILATYTYTNSQNTTKTFTQTYTVEDYFKAFQKAGTTGKAKTDDMIKATANYGYFAQKLLPGSNTASAVNFVNGNYSSDRKAAISEAVKSFEIQKSDSFDGIITASLDLESQTRFNISSSAQVLSADSTTVNDTLGIARPNRDVIDWISGYNAKGITITGIAPRMLGNSYKIEYDNEWLFTASPLSYVNAVLNTSAVNALDETVQENTKNAGYALYEYYAAAKALHS